MEKLYKKNKVLFAVVWIVLYCVLASYAQNSFGINSIYHVAVLALIAAPLTGFIDMNQLHDEIGLKGWPKDAKRYQYFIPMWVLATGNLWGGIVMNYKGLELLYAVLSMALVGYIEEIIFRGLLFRAMIPGSGIKVAVIVSAVTFGIGHIINLLTGQASVETVIQIIFALAWGFLFTMVYYKSGNLLPCIIAHAMIDVLSVFSRDSVVLGWVYMGVTVVVAAVYCVFLARVPKEEH